MNQHIVLIFSGFLSLVYGSNILVITSMPAHSHFTLAFTIAKELAGRQHQVTFINPFPQKVPIQNLRDISIDETVDFVEETRKVLLSMDAAGKFHNHVIERMIGAGIVEYAFNDTEVQALMNSNASFDVVIIEHFVNEALVGLAHHFKAPFILLAAVPSCFKNNYLTGNPASYSYVPDLFGTYSSRMNFWERLQNALSIGVHEIITANYMLPTQKELFKKYVKTDLELEDVLYNVSLVLTNSHPSVNYAIPHLPNVIEIGGYHVLPPKKLPKDLQEFLDNSKNGVIVFSMGSNVKSKDLSVEVRHAILSAFSKIQANVLWKFETELPDTPKNVKIMKWLPQNDVLAHPNVKGFITHGGLLGLIEGVHYGLPLIGIPIFGDQHSNIAVAVENEYAISMPLNEINENNFLHALNEILHNKKYKENAAARSKSLRDQPLTPMDNAVFWIEYVIRNKGAPHLRAAGVDLKWYQREILDVYCFILAVMVLVPYVIFIGVSFLIRKVTRQKPVDINKKVR